MALQFRQGPNSDRLSVTPAAGEPIWITDTKQLFVGDGVTAGGVLVGDTATFSTGTFNSIQIGSTAGNTISIVQDSLFIASTTSVVVSAPNGFAVTGNTPGNANIYVDNIQPRLTNGNVDVLTTMTVTGVSIGYNNGEITIPNVTVDADNMLIKGTGNNGALMFSSKTSAGVQRNFAWANSRLRFDLSQFIYPNPTDGSMTLGGGTTGGVDGLVTVKDWSGSNDLLIDPATGVRLLSTQSVKLSVNDLVNPGIDAFAANTNTVTLTGLEVYVNDPNANPMAVFTNNGSTHYGNYHNFGNSNQNVQINSQGSGEIKIIAGTDANDSGYLRVTKTDVRLGGPTSLDMITVNTASVTVSTTATIQGLDIGYNNGAITIPNVTADADNMWIRTKGNNGAIMLTCKTSAGANRNMAWANGRMRFDNSAVINPGTALGSLTINGGQASGVDGPVSISDYSSLNAVTIDPSFGVGIATTGTYNWTFGLEGLATLPVLTAAPATPTIGMLGVADGVTWDPAGYSTTTAYVTFYNGTAWTALG